MIIRDEEPADLPAIREVVEAAFPEPAEARLVEQLKADGDAVLSLVAIQDGVVVGYVMFSKMTGPFRALGLGPVAVTPSHQRTGIGSRLIREGLARARADGWKGVFVLGDPNYYRRFGFDAGAAAGFASPYAGPYLMALALDGGRLPASTGKIDYAPAFAALG